MNRPETILIVDDETSVLDVVALLLRQEGFIVRTALSGEVALAAVADAPPDLILIDIIMPGLNGFEVCRRLKAQETTRRIPIIFISGKLDIEDKCEAFKVGGVDYISKPFYGQEVVARVRTHLQLSMTEDLQREIKERRAAEEERKKEQERLALAADAGQVGMFDLDMETGNLQWTPQHEIIFGYKPTPTHATSERTYLDWSSRVHPDDLPMIEEQMQTALQEKASFHIEYRLIWPDGSLHWVHVVPRYFYDDSGRCLRFMGAVRDITREKESAVELRKYSEQLEVNVSERTAELQHALGNLAAENAARQGAEEELLRNQQMLIQRSRLAAMGEMINNIAHQWRQPLNNVGLISQSISLFYNTNKFNKEFLETSIHDIMDQIRHMSQTIDDFRNFFKPDKEKQNFSTNGTIQQAINLILNCYESSFIKIDTKLKEDTFIYGYPGEFAQVLLNILQNARDVLVERNISAGQVIITSSGRNGKTVITIADNAGGIPEEIIEKIFDPYFSTKGGQGTGIGLNMSKHIIETNMGGRLTVRNTDKGAEFRIEV